jgi:hypothetical protein
MGHSKKGYRKMNSSSGGFFGDLSTQAKKEMVHCWPQIRLIYLWPSILWLIAIGLIASAFSNSKKKQDQNKTTQAPGLPEEDYITPPSIFDTMDAGDRAMGISGIVLLVIGIIMSLWGCYGAFNKGCWLIVGSLFI